MVPGAWTGCEGPSRVVGTAAELGSVRGRVCCHAESWSRRRAGSRGMPAAAAAADPFPRISLLVDSCHQAWSPGQGYEDQVS